MSEKIRFAGIVLLSALIPITGANVLAQTTQIPEDVPELHETPELTPIPDGEATPIPELSPDGFEIPDPPEVTIPKTQSDTKAKDLTIRSESDRQEILDELFVNLERAPNTEAAMLVAEEIWAVFLQSRSASVDFLLLRGIKAQQMGDLKLARRMFNHVIRLQPEFAEGWSRSGRLAIDEKNMSRAASDTAQSLILQPRHFYALWTLGNILETLGKPDEAFEAYEEAARLHPQHKEINARLEYLRADVQGKAL